MHLVITVAFARSPDTSLAAYSASSGRASSFAPPARPTPQAVMPNYAEHERLAPPPMSDPPTQVELGHYVYYLSCMACHGDWGQGLTEEWRNVLNPFDRNCWQSKCHAANHPPEGFKLPRHAPPVIGENTLVDYQTADDLHTYLSAEMPWPFPGLLEEEQNWQLAAFLADANGVAASKEPLGPDNAAHLFLRPDLAPIYRSGVGLERVVTGMVLVLLLSAAILQRWSRAR
jgi:cytochrome c